MNKSSIPNHVSISDISGALIYSTIDPSCANCFQRCVVESELVSDCGVPGQRRRGAKNFAEGKVFLCSSEPDLLRSSKTFRRKLEFLGEMLFEVVQIKKIIRAREAEKTNRLIHNLTSLNAHCTQELYALVAQEDLSRATNYDGQKELLVRAIKSDPAAAAAAFARILRYETSVKNEFSVYRKLYDPTPNLKIQSHRIHAVFRNVASLFFPDFYDNGIQFDLSKCDLSLIVDYESLHVAIYHLLDNATKYAERNTVVSVSFEESRSKFTIYLRMHSAFIPPEESERIFEESFSGSHAKLLGRAGGGLGLGLVRQLLQLNKGRFYIKPGEPMRASSPLANKDLRYSDNTFIIEFDVSVVDRSSRL